MTPTFDGFVYPHRNGETTLPELSPNEFSYYWFDGIAHQEDWRQAGQLILVTAKRTYRVVGLVVVAMMLDMKHPLKDERGFYIHNCPLMIAEPETAGYNLADCEGRWWGPVHMPRLADDLMPTMAAVVEYNKDRRQWHEEAKAQP